MPLKQSSTLPSHAEAPPTRRMSPLVHMAESLLAAFGGGGRGEGKGEGGGGRGRGEGEGEGRGRERGGGGEEE